MNKNFYTNQEYYQDFYFIYVLTGANYLRPLIKYLPNIPDKTNVVVLTNTPKTLNDIKPSNFNLIIDDLDKYRDDWSIENEKIINIEDEQSYMDEYRRLYYGELYRYPMAIMRFGMNWAIKNNIKKFIIIDVGCKIGWGGEDEIIETGFKRLYELSKEQNIMFGATHFKTNDDFGGHLKLNAYLSDTIKKYIPNYNPETYPKYVSTSYHEYDKIKEEIIRVTDNKDTGVVFDGYCIGFWVNDINIIKTAFDFWCDIVQTSYKNKWINPKQLDSVVVQFEFALHFISSLLSKYYNTTISPHYTIIRHFYQPENDWIINKINHMNFQPTKTREEFLRINKEKIIAVNGEEIANAIIDGFDKI
jgi:hypothetical protein